MNFLGHALISLALDDAHRQQTLYDNFAGDFYKGPVAALPLPAALRAGVVLHRRIDSLADRADNPLYPLLGGFGRCKGIVADMFIDHFLCRDFERLFRQDLAGVAADILRRVGAYRPLFPAAFARTFAWLEADNVLPRYGDRAFLARAFAGIAQRLRRGDILTTATAVLDADEAAFAGRAVQAFFRVRRESMVPFLRGDDACRLPPPM
ncbi:ACP phosphodiesterase [uncultured Cardiobacterium sp.]|uniref:ACP phosphodiesterase n=1 Tax=uncultured Cardiobacterium sp. TaxID=417619 RepID=UPI00261F6A11|nr:ACP phosphodiesterase [uncultured Cardiobacterium sp.]